MKRNEPSLRAYNGKQKPALKWRVYFTDVQGRRVDQKFKTKTEAEKFLNEKTDKTKRLGTEDAGLVDKETERMAASARRLLDPYGKSIEDAVEFFIEHLKATEHSSPLNELVEDFLASMKRAGKSERYLGDLTNRLERFAGDHGETLVAQISSRMVDQWLAGLKVANLTRNHYRRVLSVFFGWCMNRGFCKSNPVKQVEKAKAISDDIELFTPIEMREALHLADSMGEGFGDVLAMLCICGFAGLRASEFERLTWEDVKRDRGFIDLSKGKTKTAQRRLVTIRPVLDAWLNRFSFLTGPITKEGFASRLKTYKAALASGDPNTRRKPIRWKHNALRHGFASYLLADTENPGEVSLQLGHNNSGIVFKHYRELVTKEDAADYWSLTPDRVVDGEEPVTFPETGSLRKACRG